MKASRARANSVVDWKRRCTRSLPRSDYERVIHRIINGKPLKVGRSTYRTDRIQSWYEISFCNVRTGRRRVFNLDDLVRHVEL